MDMDGWRDILHFDLYGEHVLFSSLRLSSPFNFLLASLLTIFLCALEKTLTYVLSSKWNPLPLRNSRFGDAAFRASVYWILTLTRLLYMLLAMTFHVGLILVAVTTLSAGQFVIEYLETVHPHAERNYADATPLLGRRDFAHSAEYLDVPGTGTTDRLLGTPGYSPRGNLEPRGKEVVRARAANGNGTTIFTIDDGEE